MDDRNFDQKTAEDWIQTIENSTISSREKDIYPTLRSWIEQLNAKQIMEIGCGQGICSSRLNLTDRYYVGVEPSIFLLERAKQLYSTSNKSFVAGNAYGLPVKDHSQDAVFSVSVWHLLGDIQKASSELSRVLNPNGGFLIITANPEAYSVWTSVYVETKKNGHRLEGKAKSDLWDVLYLHTMQEIKKALEDAHLKIIFQDTFRTVETGEKMYLVIHGKKISNAEAVNE